MDPLRTIFELPGWQGSDASHWQSRWEAVHGDLRIEQHDWVRPLRGDWCSCLEEAVLTAPGQVVLIAHSLGCLLVAAWAAHSRNAGRVDAAMLVAPADLERDDLRQMIPGWAPIHRGRLPFRSLVVSASNDPYCAQSRAREFAESWGSRFVDGGERGHLNGDSGLADWPEGRAYLHELLEEE